jgi:hypothetical protein
MSISNSAGDRNGDPQGALTVVEMAAKAMDVLADRAGVDWREGGCDGGDHTDHVRGASIGGFVKGADAMLAYGVV